MSGDKLPALAGIPLAVPFERSFDALYGVQLVAAGDGRARANVPVRDELLGTAGSVHSGVYAAVAESLASVGTAVDVLGDGRVVSGLSNATTVLAEVSAGTLNADARCVAHGDGEWVWTVAVTAEDGAPCATATVVIAVREPRG